MKLKFKITILAILCIANISTAQVKKQSVCNKPMKTLAYPQCFLDQKKPAMQVCEAQLGKMGEYYDDIFELLSPKGKTGKRHIFQLTSSINDPYFIHIDYGVGKLGFSCSIYYNDANYALLDFDYSGRVIVDKRKRIIMAFTPDYMLYRAPQQMFFQLYFLDARFFPYASLDVVPYKTIKTNTNENLYLTRYRYYNENLDKDFLDYKLDKTIFQITYADIIAIPKLLKTQKFKVVGVEKRLQKGRTPPDSYLVPIWF